MLFTERRFPAASDAPQAGLAMHRGSAAQGRSSPIDIDREVQRCRAMVQASKAERLYQSARESRRAC